MATRLPVIAQKFLPIRLPFHLSLTLWLWLDRIQASNAAWGVVTTIMVILWIGAIIVKVAEDEVSVKDLL